MQTASLPRLALLSPGQMGAGIAARLLTNGLPVVTCLEGRGGESRARAQAIGLPDVPLAALAQVDLLLSVVPPAFAEDLARRVADAGVFAAGGPLFVDCNAVSPDTMARIEATIRAAGGRCVDSGIVGAPPSADGKVTPVLYVSGPGAGALAVLGEHGLEVQVLDAPVGAASALKMCFAAVSKGLTALVTQVALAAGHAQIARPLHAQLARSLGQSLAWAGRQSPQLVDKSWRWAPEMEEIAQFLRDVPGAATMFEGAARYYEWLDSQKEVRDGAHAHLARFFSSAPPLMKS